MSDKTVTLTLSVDEAISLGAATTTYSMVLPAIVQTAPDPMVALGALAVAADMPALTERIELALALVGEFVDEAGEARMRAILDAPDDISGI